MYFDIFGRRTRIPYGVYREKTKQETCIKTRFEGKKMKTNPRKACVRTSHFGILRIRFESRGPVSEHLLLTRGPFLTRVIIQHNEVKRK